jgi:hypothetical protein
LPWKPYSVSSRIGWPPMRAESVEAPITATPRGLSRRDRSGAAVLWMTVLPVVADRY